MLRAGIWRDGDTATLDDTTEHRGGAHFMFAPIYEAWGKAIRQEWLSRKRSGAADTVNETG
jgi:hypothetical protein